MYVCACRCIHVNGCELTMGMYMHTSAYECIHTGSETYLLKNY